MLYTVSYLSDGMVELHGDKKSILDLVCMLESQKLPYKVGTTGCYLTQGSFGWGGFDYWMDASFVFGSE